MAIRKEIFRWQLVASREVSGSQNVTDPHLSPQVKIRTLCPCFYLGANIGVESTAILLFIDKFVYNIDIKQENKYGSK